MNTKAEFLEAVSHTASRELVEEWLRATAKEAEVSIIRRERERANILNE
jgi:hypothetical protein